MGFRPVRFLALSLLILGLVGGGLYLYRTVYLPRVYQTSYDQGRALYGAGSPAAAAAVFERAAAAATGVADEGPAKLNLGTALLFVDAPRGITILKEVAVDERYNDSIRAAAMVTILQYWDLYKADRADGIAFAADQIFVGADWAAFLSNRTPLTLVDIRRAEIGVLEAATNVYPLVAGEYTLASLYAGEVLEAASSGPDYASLAASAKQHLQRGDAVFPVSRSAPSQLVIGLVRKGEALSALNRAGIAVPAADIEAAFRRALEISEANPANRPAQFYNFRARFRLASVLADQPARQKEIADLLGPVLNGKDTTPRSEIYRFLAGLDAHPANDPDRLAAIGLAHVDPGFRDLLVALGWRSEGL